VSTIEYISYLGVRLGVLGALSVVEGDGGLEESELEGVENDVLGGPDDLELDAEQGVSLKVMTVVVWYLPSPG
jgi:hypothetical protein